VVVALALRVPVDKVVVFHGPQGWAGCVHHDATTTGAHGAIAVAGPLAELRHLYPSGGTHTWGELGALEDGYQFAEAEASFKVTTDEMLEGSWPLVELVANELQRRRILTGHDLEALFQETAA